MTWEAKIIHHRKQDRIAVFFPKRKDYIERIKKLEGVRWSATLGAWHLPDTDENRERFKLPPRFVQNPEHAQKIDNFKRWLASKRYAENTIQTYTDALKSFLAFYNEKPIAVFESQDLITYNNDYILKNKLSSSFQNQIVNAIKLFFKSIEHQQMNPELLHRPKKEKTLPNVLSKEEVKMILEAHTNIKHKTMLSVIYSCGLRRSEVLNLTPNDIDSKRGVIIIRQAKGKKDRIAPLSEKILIMLREYYKLYMPKVWLFEGQKAGEQYDERSIQLVLKQALAKTKITKPVTLHWLRHSYATHLHEGGIDIRNIQVLLGHKSSSTTDIYTHVSNKTIQQIKSPFDDLDI
jgi:integrase/recombinase XerD